MPRKQIKLKEKVEYLSILDGKGQVDESLDPKLDADRSIYLYRLMLTARRLDERMLNLQRQGRIGTYGPCRGQEAAHCASAIVMDKEDWIVQAFREPGACIHRGWPIERVIQFWGGYEEGCEPPENVNDTPIAVPISTQTVHAMGIGLGMKAQGHTGKAVLCFLGDGGTSEGDFHEAMNFCGAYGLPVVFFVENNQWAISIPRKDQTASETIAQKAVAYGFDGIQVDGNDPLAVYVATKEAVDKARTRSEPTLIEAVTYRLSVHTTADDPTKYRSDDEVKKWEKLDPIPRFQKFLRERGILDDKLIAEVEQDVLAEVKAGVERYEAAREVDPLDCFRFMYTEMPDELQEQMEEFRKALQDEGIGLGH